MDFTLRVKGSHWRIQAGEELDLMEALEDPFQFLVREWASGNKGSLRETRLGGQLE